MLTLSTAISICFILLCVLEVLLTKRRHKLAFILPIISGILCYIFLSQAELFFFRYSYLTLPLTLFILYFLVRILSKKEIL